MALTEEKNINNQTLQPTKPAAQPTVALMVEDIVGCKWSLQVLAMVRQGTCRPGAMARAVDGLTTKVLNERLSKMVRFGILEKISYPEIPPRVEYALTDFGHRFIGVLDAIENLQSSLNSRPDQNAHSSSISPKP